MNNVRMIVLMGTSPDSWEAALQQVLEDVPDDVGEIIGVDVVHQSAGIEDRKVIEYRVTVHVSYFENGLRDPDIARAVEA